MFAKVLVFAIFGVSFVLSLSHTSQDKGHEEKNYKLDLDIATLTIGGHKFKLEDNEESKKLKTNASDVKPENLTKWLEILSKLEALEKNVEKSSSARKDEELELVLEAQAAFKKIVIDNHLVFHELGIILGKLNNVILSYLGDEEIEFYTESKNLVSWLELQAISLKQAATNAELQKLRSYWWKNSNKFEALRTDVADIFETEIKSYHKNKKSTIVKIDGVGQELRFISRQVADLLIALRETFKSIIAKNQKDYVSYGSYLSEITHIFDELRPEFEGVFEDSISTLQRLSLPVYLHEELNRYKSVLVEPDNIVADEEYFETEDATELTATEDIQERSEEYSVITV